jgi:tetratricopeptide (TPR) repeat protein
MLVVLFPIFLEYTFSNYYYNKGLVALQNKQSYKAEEFFRKAMRDLGGSNTIAAIKATEIKLADNGNRRALAYIKAGLSFAVKTPYRARLYYMRGLAERNLHHMEKAGIAFEQALSLNYNPDSVYKALAPIYAYELRKYDKALASYDSLMQAEPHNIDHYLNRGFCYQKLNQHRVAIADFDYFMANKGVNGSVLYLKAISQISLEEIDSACVNFNRSADMGIKNAYTFINIYCKPDTAKIVYPANPF